jgi:hypothetical protein
VQDPAAGGERARRDCAADDVVDRVVRHDREGHGRGTYARPVVIVFGILAAVIVFVIAAVAIGRETKRLDAEPPRPVFDVDEAVDWIGDRLPFQVAAELSHDDVRQILRWSLDQLAVRPDDEVLVVDDEAVAYVQVRARDAGFDWAESHIEAVLEREIDYLRAIGAINPEES